MWYLAQLVISFQPETVVGESVDVHINYVLVNAHDRDAALDKAMQMGESANYSFVNPNNEAMKSHFHGLADLAEIHEPFEDGCEIYFEWHEVPVKEIESFVTPPESLAVFVDPRS